MSSTTDLLRLMSWLSPVFPTGGYAYSGGLEQMVHGGAIHDAQSLKGRIAALLKDGPPWNDAVLFAAAFRSSADGETIEELSELARAMAGSLERHREALDQGAAFLAAAANWFEAGALPASPTPLCVAVGAACGLQSMPAEEALAAFLHAWVSNQLQAAIRLSVVGQSGAARLLSELEPAIAETAARAKASTPGDLGSCTILADIAAMNHETLEPRLFLS
ncbi:urease accessory protein UreF [Oricola cellulosilytica]|uniref:Urease accessory protein UreF n=1 Tax=Oricola cellulosilytica TaxID=1429082 RepID=A0A4R0PDZ0_9HYPH|nr:urease accessory protein UreF [Oricola cellulosilytica]TCD14973.1 urease accessory protein UreF [Oricola cellulosilytica]